MATKDQYIDYPLTEGIQSKSNEHLSEGLALAQNIIMTDEGTPRKRNGFDDLITDFIDDQESGNISFGRSLSVLNNELVVQDEKYLYGYSESVSKWIRKGQAQRFSGKINTLSSQKLVDPSNRSEDASHYCVTHAENSTIRIVSYCTGDGVIYIDAYDKESNTIINSFSKSFSPATDEMTVTSLSFGTSINPKIGAFYGRFDVITAGKIKFVKYDALSNSFTEYDVSDSNMCYSVSERMSYDVINYGNGFAIASFNIFGTGLKIETFDGSLSGIAFNVTDSILLLDANPPNDREAICIEHDTVLSRFFVSYSTTDPAGPGTVVLRSAFLNNDLTIQTGVFTLKLFDPSNREPITQITLGIMGDNLITCYTYSPDNSPQTGTSEYIYTIISTAVSSAEELISENLNISSKVFINDGLFYLYCVLGGSQYEQSVIPELRHVSRSVLLVNLEKGKSAKVCGRFLNGSAHDIPKEFLVVGDQFITNNRVVSVPLQRPLVENEKHYYIATKRISGSSGATDYFWITSLEKINLDYKDDLVSSPLFYNKSLFIPGAIPLVYDGEKVFEYGFNHQAIIEVLAFTPGGLPIGIYSYIAIYEHIDNRGVVHVSEPSQIEQITLAVPGTMVVTVKRYEIGSLKDSVKIHLYRAPEGRADVFYRVSGAGNDNNNNTAFTDSMNESDLLKQQSYYFQGITVSPRPPSATSSASIYKNRLVTISAEEQNLSEYSQEVSPPLESGFSDFFKIGMEDTNSNYQDSLECLAGMDDKIIYFKKDSILALAGDGPNRSGLNDTFSKPVLISTEVGSVNPRSLILTGLGIFFQDSTKGIYLVSRSLEITYIGAPVEAFNSEQITGAINSPTDNYILFTTKNGNALIYDYNHGVWSHYSNFNSNSVTIWKNKLVHLKSSGVVGVENTSKNDNSNFIPQKIITSWFKISGIQAFGRVKKLLILGKFKSNHNLKISLAYDYEDYNSQETTYTPLSANYNRVLAPTDQEIYEGANSGVYQVEIGIERQKCTALKITIEDIETDTQGESFELTALSFLVGFKKGVYKLSSNKKT